MRRNQATAAINGVCNNGDRFLLSLLVCFTTEKTGDLPTGGLLHIAHLLTANGQHRVERHETDFATGREHLDDRQHRICRRIVQDDAHQIQAECLDDGCVLSIAGAYLDTVADRKYPVGCVGLGRVGELVCGYFVEARLRRRTNKAVVCGSATALASPA
jgi:hypothetical protein